VTCCYPALCLLFIMLPVVISPQRFPPEGRKQPSRARPSIPAVVVLALCAVPSGISFFAIESSISSQGSGFGATQQLLPNANRVLLKSGRVPEARTNILPFGAQPVPNNRYAEAMSDDILLTLRLFRAPEAPPAKNHVASKPLLSESTAVPHEEQRRWSLRKSTIALSGVAMATMLLRLVTQRLDVLACSASALLSATPSSLAAAAAGAAAGGLHTLSGPDHLAALAPLALKVQGGPSGAFRAGIFWGSGHVLGQVLLGLGLLVAGRCGLMAAFGTHYGWAAERLAAGAVGVVLVLIGMLGLKEAREWKESGGVENDGMESDARGCSSLTWKTFGTGVLSGMHPDALLLCLPALALPTRLTGLSYLMAFGMGTLAAMGTYTAALHCACRRLGQQTVGRVSTVASGVAVAVGAAICSTALGIPLLGGLM